VVTLFQIHGEYLNLIHIPNLLMILAANLVVVWKQTGRRSKQEAYSVKIILMVQKAIATAKSWEING